MFNFECESRRTSIAAARQAAEQSADQLQRDIFESHRHHAFSLAFYMTGNEIEAEEILEQTFVHAFEQKAEPDRAGIDLALMDQLFERFPSMRKPRAPELSSAMGSTGIGAQQVLRTDLEIAIRELPPAERLLFLLRDVEGYQVEDAGSLLGLSQARAKAALFSARLHLRQALASAPRRSSEAA